MLSTEGFSPSERKGLLQHTVINEVFASYANLLIGQEASACPWSALMGVRIKWAELRELYGLSPGTMKTV